MKINSLFNILGSSFFTIFCFLIFPIYLSIMSKEEYGLFSLFFVILIYSRFFEIGLGNTLLRFIPKNSNSVNLLSSMKTLVNIYEIYFTILTFIFILIFLIFGFSIVNNWLNFDLISINTISISIFFMILIISIKYFINIYRSALNGFERQIITNSLRILSDFFSLIGGLLVYFISKKYILQFEASVILYFFISLITFVEFIVLKRVLTGEFLLRKVPKIKFSFDPLKNTFKFSFFSSIISMIWISSTWMDRIIWSSILNLEHYGYFVTTTFFASVVLIFIAAINLAILPRISNLYSQKNYVKIFDILKISNNFCSFICFSITFFIFFFSYEILFVWTGSYKLSIWSKEILIFYALAYGAISLTHIYSTLLNALGNLYILFKFMIIWSIFVSISFVINALYFNIEYSGISFLFVNFTYYLVFVLILDRHYIQFNFLKLLKDTFYVGLLFFFLYFIMFKILAVIEIESRLIKFIQLIFSFTIVNIIVLLTFSVFRTNIYKLIIEFSGIKFDKKY